MKSCECGCGHPTRIAHQSDSKRGYVKGEPCRFLPGHNQRHAELKGRYRQVYRPAHPRAKGDGVVYEHILIAERALGSLLPDGAEVHHVDENGRNNAPSNLVICQDKAYHKLLHYRARVVRAGANPNTHRLCSLCKHALPLAEFGARRANISAGRQSACKNCMNQYRRQRKQRAA